jgi:hypothetical protein
MQRLQPLARHVGVDRGGGDVGVAQQHLHRAQVGAVVQQVRGEGMAQGVRRQRRGDAGRRACFFTSIQNMARVMPLPRAGDEQVVGLLPAQDGGRASAR